MKKRLSRAFHPPAAVVPVAVRAPDGRDERALDGKIDTGGDLCALPHAIIGDLALPAERVVRVAPVLGATKEIVVYRMDLSVGGERFSYVETIGSDRPYGIIGRNVLRELLLRLDGPGETVELKRPRARRRLP